MPEVPGSRPLEVFTSREPWDQPSRARESSLSEDERTRSPGKKLYSDRVPSGERDSSARQAEVLAKDAQKVIYCHPSLPVKYPPRLCKKDNF